MLPAILVQYCSQCRPNIVNIGPTSRRYEFSPRVRTLYLLLNKNSGMSTSNKLLIYKTVIRPVITYACPAWSLTSRINLNKLQVLQNKFLRFVRKYPRYAAVKQMYEELNIEIIVSLVRRLIINFYIRIDATANILFENLNYEDKK